MKKILNMQTGEITTEQLTAEEVAEKEELRQKRLEKEASDALKASARAKLVAGEALTEEEANTIVI
jgi:phosphoglycerol transferase MdoB-like AlkP superfamily enzyme